MGGTRRGGHAHQDSGVDDGIGADTHIHERMVCHDWCHAWGMPGQSGAHGCEHDVCRDMDWVARASGCSGRVICGGMRMDAPVEAIVPLCMMSCMP